MLDRLRAESLTVADNHGAADACQDVPVVITDTTPPVVTAEPTMITAVDTDCSGDEAVTMPAPAATDECGDVIVTDDASPTGDAH